MKFVFSPDVSFVVDWAQSTKLTDYTVLVAFCWQTTTIIELTTLNTTGDTLHAEIKIPFLENEELTKVSYSKPGIGQNILFDVLCLLPEFASSFSFIFSRILFK